MVTVQTISLALAAAIGATAAADTVAAREIPEVIPTRPPNDGIQPVAEFDDAGRLHLLWFVGDPAGGDIHHALRPAGADGFGDSVRVNSTDEGVIAVGTVRGAWMALGGGDRVHVAWMGSGRTAPDGDHHQVPMLYSRSTDGGRSFQPERNVITKAFGLDGGGTVAADDEGNVAILWHAGPRGAGEVERQVWVSRSADDGKTFAPEVPAWDEPTGACGCCGMTAAASDDGVWAIYRAATDGVHRDLFLLRPDGTRTGFEGLRLDRWESDACPMSTMSLAHTGTTTFAAWETRDGGLAFTRCGSDVSGRVPPGEASRKFPEIALAPDGRILLAWIEGAGWNRAGRLAWQLFEDDGTPIGAPTIGPESAVWTRPSAVFDGEAFRVFH